MGPGDQDVAKVPFAGGVISLVECSPFNFCDSLIAMSSYTNSDNGHTEFYLTIARLHQKRAPDQMLEVLKQYQQERLVTSISWSPKTFIDSLPYTVMVAVGDSDGRVAVLSTDLKDSNDIMDLDGHRKWVNCVALDPEQGELLASVGDDCQCIVWNTQTKDKYAEFALKSAGVDVKFHRYDTSKLLVAEKSGLMRFYDVTTMSAFLSVDAGISPLKAMYWSDSDVTRVQAVAAASWIQFDTAASFMPVSQVNIGDMTESVNCCTSVRGNANTNLVALGIGRGNTVKVRSQANMDEDLVTFSSLAGSGFCWHVSQPLLFCGGDHELFVTNCENLN